MSRPWRAVLAAALTCALLGAACTGSGGSGRDSGDSRADAGPPSTIDGGPVHLRLEHATRCEFLGADDQCLLPFPSDRFTVADNTTDTGSRAARFMSRVATPGT